MNESFQKNFNQLKDVWRNRTNKQKLTVIGSLVLFIVIISLIVFFTTRVTMVPLYSNLSPSETGAIKENLDGRGIVSEISGGGTTIKVPEQFVDTLKVELAAQGIPKSGSIDYSFFSQNAGIGTTDNEFKVIKLDAMQTELANLMKGIEGINDAKVMVSLPEKGIFVSAQNEEASASIVLNTKPGYQFEESQIKALYHLVSKSVPNLPTNNIVIMNQYFEYFSLDDDKNTTGNSFKAQNNIKKEIEKDVQRQVQSMLGTIMGHDKVVVSVTADVDFTQENREENLVTPVDAEKMAGIAISAQKLTETFTGSGAVAQGTPQAEGATDTLDTYLGENGTSDGDYEKIQETINSEVNRIRKQIVESPYRIRDLGIQVMVEPPNPDDPSSLSEESINDISKILGTIVRTTIDKQVNLELSDEAISDKIAISVQKFNGKPEFKETTVQTLPWWTYLVGGGLLAIIALLAFLYFRKARSNQMDEQVLSTEYNTPYVPDVNIETETENSVRKKQLEKMAKEKPEDFAKLLRSWIAEE